MLVGKPFSLKELVETLRAENKSQVRAEGAVFTDRVSAATTEEEIQRAWWSCVILPEVFKGHVCNISLWFSYWFKLIILPIKILIIHAVP